MVKSGNRMTYLFSKIKIILLEVSIFLITIPLFIYSHSIATTIVPSYYSSYEILVTFGLFFLVIFLLWLCWCIFIYGKWAYYYYIKPELIMASHRLSKRYKLYKKLGMTNVYWQDFMNKLEKE